MDFMSILKEIEESSETTEIEKLVEEYIPGIATKAQADDYLELYKKVEEERKEVEEYAKQKLEEYTKRVNEYKEKELRRIDGVSERLEGMLMKFYIDSGETKRIKLVNGSLGFRKQRDKIEYEDEDKVIELLKELDPTLIRTKYSLSKRDINKVIQHDGENVYIKDRHVDGAKFIKGEDKFNIL